MKLAEGLLERKEKLKKMERLQEEIRATVVTTSDETVDSIDINNLLDNLSFISDEVQALNVRINKANALYQAENLTKLQQYDKMISFYKEIRNKILNPREQRTFFGENVSFNKNYDHKIITKTLEDLERSRSQVDRELTKSNWQIDI